MSALDVESVLEVVRGYYDRARESADLFALHVSWAVPPLTCRYCGRHWQKWAGSKLDGHAKCMVTSEFKETLATTIRDTLVSYAAIAKKLDVSTSVVRSWVAPMRGGR